MTPQPYEIWTSHAGDLAFTITAPAAWAEDQRDYLAQYLPGRVGDRDLGTFHLAVYPDDAQCHEVVWQVTNPPIARRIEPIPGVVLLETRMPSGMRCYAVAADGVEHQARAFAVRVHERHIELYLHHGVRKPHGYPLRLMREAMLRTYEDHGGIVFHAAGADLGGHGVMICGPRSAGKTTVLTCLLRSTRGALLSNDRLILDRHGRLVAVPLPVPIARGTLDAVPELANAVPGLSRPQRTISELPRTFGATEKAEFSAREYATALGASLAPGSWLRTILVPRLSDSAEPPRIRALPPGETQQVLRASCFTPHDEFWQQPWLVPRGRPEPELHRRAHQLTHHLAAHIPCFEIRFGIRNPLDELDKTVLDIERHPR
ncbi:hypothetical protein MOQ72_32395 [Saccharopolyspora sp. K220]|uniref:hypothetical protein n=1 Tax=Saccharopolyspora soli TaxID=2926618 RepID=UPI001F5ABC67|nr:hypothetical protein [Saccharopolyspora soli]MCI2422141.1 hypothetical protein [Saccharopolyspora soli]